MDCKLVRYCNIDVFLLVSHSFSVLFVYKNVYTDLDNNMMSFHFVNFFLARISCAFWSSLLFCRKMYANSGSRACSGLSTKDSKWNRYCELR
jgi:hypothetical protein